MAGLPNRKTSLPSATTLGCSAIWRPDPACGQAGRLYAPRSIAPISDKPALRQALQSVAQQLRLRDPTVKVYNTIFFLFCMLPHTLSPAKLIESVQQAAAPFAQWDKEYLFTAIEDTQEPYIRRDLQKLGFAYDEG